MTSWESGRENSYHGFVPRAEPLKTSIVSGFLRQAKNKTLRRWMWNIVICMCRRGLPIPLSGFLLLLLLLLHLHLHLYLDREGRWGSTDDLTTSFLHFFPVLSTALLDMANPRPGHSLVLILSCSSVGLVFFTLSVCLARWFWQDLMTGRHVHTTSAYVSLQWPGLCVVRLPAGSWHGLPR